MRKNKNSYWTQKSEYIENRPSENNILVYNKNSNADEIVKLTDFVNSYNDFMNINNESIKRKNSETIREFNKEVEKIINLRNITGDKEASEAELKEKENIKKLMKYVNELKKENNE